MSQAKIALATHAANLYDDATQGDAISRIEAESIGRLRGDYVFADGSVISMDHMSSSVTASDAHIVQKADVDKLIAEKNSAQASSSPAKGFMARMFSPVLSRSPFAGAVASGSAAPTTPADVEAQTSTVRKSGSLMRP